MNPSGVPPHDLMAERAVIAACLISEDVSVAMRAGVLLAPEHFYRTLHQRVFKAIAGVVAVGHVPDITSVQDELRRLYGKSNDIAIDELLAIADAHPTRANLEHYAEIVRRHAEARLALQEIAAMEARLRSGKYLPADFARIRSVDQRPTPLEVGYPLPAFPTDGLPPEVRGFVLELARFTQTPPDLAGCLALSALSAAASGRVRVRARGGWVEPAHLWTFTLLPSGERKSAVLQAMVAVLERAELALMREARLAISAALTRKKIAEARASEAQENASHGDPSREAEDEAVARSREADEIEIPAAPRILLADATPEAVASQLADQDGRIAMFCAEATPFALLGRYTRDGSPNLETFLKAHAGDTIRVDRRNRPPEIIENPALTLGVAAQPEVLEDLGRIPELHGRGFLARLLIAVPRPMVGHRAVGQPAVPQAVVTAYERLVTGMLEAFWSLAEPWTLTLSPEAERELIDFERRLEPRLDPETGDLSHLSGWAGKLSGAVLRIAGLLHAAANFGPDGEQRIDLETIRTAIRFGEYFLGHALAAFSLMGRDPATEDAKLVMVWIRQKGVSFFSAREAFVGTRGRLTNMDRLRAALRVLEEHAHIESLPEASPPRPGRPASPRYRVNPRIPELQAHNPQNSGDRDGETSSVDCVAVDIAPARRPEPDTGPPPRERDGPPADAGCPARPRWPVSCLPAAALTKSFDPTPSGGGPLVAEGGAAWGPAAQPFAVRGAGSREEVAACPA